jgi:Ca2+-binding RTX toxin-like protein
VAWKGGTDQYSVWTTDSNGNFLSTTPVLSGTSTTLQSAETTFHQDLNGDGKIGPAAGPAPANVVKGAAGNDTIVSTPADELFFGNGGKNTFVFSGNFGKDTIADFHPAQDAIQLGHNVFANFADVMAHTEQVGHDVTTNIDATNSITVQNTVLNHLTSNNFHVV